VKSRTFRIGISVAISAVFLGFAVRGVDWNEARSALGTANYLYVIPMGLLTIWTLYIRAQRWRVLLRPVGRPAMPTLVDATNIGFMANMVLPLRVGEVIRPLLLSRREKQPLSGVLATVVLERVYDIFTILLLFGVSASAIGFSPQVQQWGYGLSFVAVVLGIGLILARWQEERALRLLDFLLQPFPERVADPAQRFASGFMQALEILDSPWTFLQVLAWTWYLWFVIALIYLLGFLAFDLQAPVIIGSVVVTTIVAIAVSAPSAPGYIGAFQLGCTISLGIFNVSEGQAFAYSIVLHLTQFVGILSAGLYSLAREGVSLRQIEQQSEDMDGSA
jgi:uncharacterized protein (TIRG00374 family)